MPKGRPRYRIICDVIDYDESYHVVGYYPPFGYILVDHYSNELKINYHANDQHCLDALRLLKEAESQLKNEDGVSNFRIAGIFKDESLLETEWSIKS